MITHQEMIGLQAEKHELIVTEQFETEEQYALHLIHTYAYIQASRFAKNKRVLDLGCNVGYGTRILSESAREAIGVDVSANAIETAKRQYRHMADRFSIIDGQRLPFDDQAFEMVVSCQVIEHIVDYSSFITEIKRVLTPSGVICFTTPNARLRLDPGMKPWNPFHVREFDHDELRATLQSYFQYVLVLGLMASDRLYAVESKRVEKARANARSHQPCEGKDTPASWRAKIEARLPRRIVASAKRMRDLCMTVTKNARTKSFIKQDILESYGLQDLYYSLEERELALDFLAICSDDGEQLELCRKVILQVS